MSQRVVILSAPDVSCVIGNLFATLYPPCDYTPKDRIILCGLTFSGEAVTVTVRPSGDSYICEFAGRSEDLNDVLEKTCLERTCGGG